MSDDLSEFFKFISDDKKKKKEEFNEMVGDLGLDSLFKDIAAEKKKVREEKEKEVAKKIEEEQKEKEEFDKLLGDMSLDSLFGDLAKAKKEVKEDKEKDKKVLASFENFLNKKIDDIEEIKEELVEEPEPEEEVLEEEIEVLQEVIVEPSLMEKSLGLLSEPSENIPGAEENFATLEDLQNHYRSFLVKIQQQLSTLGGGGETRLEFLDDVDRDTTKVNDSLLIYNSTDKKWVGIASTSISGSDQDLDATLSAGNTTVQGISVGFITGTSASFSGNVSVAGTLTYDDVTNVDSIGLITARTGIEVTSGIITAPKIHVGVGTTYSEELVVTGDARVTGILTIGTGSITLDPNAKRIQGIDEIVIGTDDADKVTIKKDNKGQIKFEDKDGKESAVGIGTTVSINTSGIVTAAQFHGDGSKITGISTLNIVDYGVGLGGGGITTFSGNYNDLTNKPTIPTNNNQLSNGAGYITTSITSYNDLSDKPSIPAAQVNSDWNASSGVEQILNKPTLFDGDYNSLTNRPTIPTNNNQLSNGAGYITGITGINTTGNSAFNNLNVSGISTLTNLAEIRSDDGTPGRIDFYCETSNAHYTRIQSAAHASYSGNAVVTLPTSTGTLLLTNGSGASLTGLTGASAGTYGDASNSAQITVDANGRITGISQVSISAGSNYANSDVDAHLNTSTASAGEILSWTGSDYAWVADQTGGGGGSSGIEVQNSGSSVGTGITVINFNTDLTATVNGTTATVNSTASGGGGSGGVTTGKAIAMAIVFG